MESNGSGKSNQQRWGVSGQPIQNTNRRAYLKVVNISDPHDAFITKDGIAQLVTLIPAYQVTNPSNMSASNVDSSNANIGNPNDYNNFSTSGYSVRNQTMPIPQPSVHPTIYNPPPNQNQPIYLSNQPGYSMISMVHPIVDGHHFQPLAVQPDICAHPNNPCYYNAPETPPGFNVNNIVYLHYVSNPALVNYDYSTGNHNTNTHIPAFNNTYYIVSNMADGYPPTSCMVAQPLNVPIFPPSIAPPVEHHPVFQPTTTRHIETGNSIPYPTRRYAPIHESVSINRLTKSHTIPIETYNMTEHNFTYEESNRQPNDSFVPVGIPNMTNIADGHPVNYVPANNYDMMSNINAHEPSYQYPYMNAPVPHSYVTERVDANYCLPRVAEHCPQVSESHVPKMYSFPTNTWRWR